jgi:hypothetical protein
MQSKYPRIVSVTFKATAICESSMIKERIKDLIISHAAPSWLLCKCPNVDLRSWLSAERIDSWLLIT